MDSFLHEELFRCLDRAAGYFGLTSPGTFSFGPFLMFYLSFVALACSVSLSLSLFLSLSLSPSLACCFELAAYNTYTFSDHDIFVATRALYIKYESQPNRNLVLVSASYTSSFYLQASYTCLNNKKWEK